MSAGDTKFAGSIPQTYERHLVPMIFAPFARDIADNIKRELGGIK